MTRFKQVTNRKVLDPILAAVLAEIHKAAVVPDKGFLKSEDWAKRWQLNEVQTRTYIARAVASRLLVEKSFRVITHGRLRMMKHYGPPKGS